MKKVTTFGTALGLFHALITRSTRETSDPERTSHKMKISHLVRYAILSCAALCFAQTAHADFTLNASNNATIRPAGPRSGGSGKVFFNIQGSANNTFASFGVVDFAVPAGTTVSGVTGLTLVLTEANAAFTMPGTLNFYLTQDTTADIEPVTSLLRYLVENAQEGLGSQLAPNFLIGSGTFNTTGNVGSGTVDTYMLTSLSSAAQAYLVSQINANGTIRLIVTPTTATVAATFAGYTNNTIENRPMLTVITASNNSASGTIAFQVGLENVPLNQPLTIILTPAVGTPITQTVTPDANGNFSTQPVPPGNYRLRVKTAGTLSEATNINLSSGNVSGLTFTLRGGDINNDNATDIGDLLLLIGVYNKRSTDAGFSPTADLNNDGADDIGDLLIIISRYNQLGNN